MRIEVDLGMDESCKEGRVLLMVKEFLKGE